jgi:hypothetical protein
MRGSEEAGRLESREAKGPGQRPSKSAAFEATLETPAYQVNNIVFFPAKPDWHLCFSSGKAEAKKSI